MPTPDSRSSVDKAFSLLRAFTPEDTTGVGVSELARRADLSKSTAHRLLNTLVQNGAVQRAGEVYRVSGFFPELGQEEITQQGELISEVLTPFLAALFERSRNTVHLGYLIGTDVSYANKLFSVQGVATPSRIGGRVPGYATGVGKAIMAYDENLIEIAIKKGLTKWTPNTIDDPEEFRQLLGRVREEGIAYDREEIQLGLSCVAAPIFGRGSVPIAAMSVSGSTSDFRPEDHIPTLKRITATASKAFLIASRDLHTG